MDTTLDRAALDDLRRLSLKPVPLDEPSRAGRWTLSIPDAARYDMPEAVTDVAAGLIVAARSFGAWRHGRVQKIGRSRIHVAFVTPSSPDRLHRQALPLSEIRLPYPAQAAALEHVR